MEKERASTITGVLSLQQPKQVVNAPFREQEGQVMNVEKECMQKGILQLSDWDLVGREEELVGGEEQVEKDANHEEHGQEAMEEHTQPQQQQHRLQEEPPALTSPALWPPPLPAEREGTQGWEDEDLGHSWGVDGGQGAGLMEGHTQPQQQQRRQEEPLRLLPRHGRPHCSMSARTSKV